MTAANAGRPQPGAPLDEEPFAILCVCTANMCRSPIAEHLVRQGLRQRFGRVAGWDWVVRSAGTHVMPGSTVHELAREALLERGIPSEGASSHQVTPSMLQRADLVLTASRSQRARVVELEPSAVRRVFTMRQFARLCAAGSIEIGGQPIERGTDLLALATLGRTRVQPVPEAEDTIVDPIGHGLDEFRACADVIEECVTQILGPIPA